MAQERCRNERPALRPLANGEIVRCHFAEDTPSLGAAAQRDARATAPAGAPVLSLQQLGVSYARPRIVDQLLGRKSSATLTVQGIDLEILPGETVALVGESGSGKSSILKAVAGLWPAAEGQVGFGGQAALGGSVETRSRKDLQRIQLIFQNPDDSLNPRHTIADILAQPLELYFGLSRSEVHTRSVALLERVRLGAHYLERLPNQLSGGEKQRVAIARAFAAEPELVLCDEVTSALDVSVQAAVLDLLDELRAQRGTAYLFVSHDLAVVRALAHRVAVLYQGRLCEVGPAAAVYASPSHPYTEVLLGAVLEPDPDHRPTLLADDVIESSPPPRGCAFQRRCPRHLGDACDAVTPPWQQGVAGHQIRCHIPMAELSRPIHAITETAGA
jgi:peptide/nickel transport system ATP-binding protein